MQHREPISAENIRYKTARKSAVLILIYPKENSLHTVLTLRNTYKGVHSAQVSFPGGKSEPEDIDAEATAIREAQEELNIQHKDIEILGRLSPLYIPPSNFLVKPIVAIQNTLPNLSPDPIEVAKIIESPLSNFMGKDKLHPLTIKQANTNMLVNAYKVNNHIIWGATAMMIKEFTEVLEKFHS